MGQLCSVYRLTVDRLEAALKPGHDHLRLDLQVADRRAMRVDRGTEDRPPDWAPSLEAMTGHTFECRTRSASSVLLVDLGPARYALAFGAGGRHLLREDAIERDFGVAIAIRSLDPGQIGDVARTALDVSSRTDVTQMPTGAHVRVFGVEQQSEIVKRIAGRSSSLDIAHLRRSGEVRLDGRDALRVRVADTPDGLVADLTAVEEAFTQGPHPELAFVEGLRPVTRKEGARFARAERALAAELARPDSERLGLALPFQLDTAGLTSFTVEIADQQVTAQEPDLKVIRDALGRVPRARRIEAFWSGRVLLSVADSADPVETPLGAWLAADLAVGDDQYVFHNGAFYRMSDRYRQTLTDTVSDLLRQGPALRLPVWRPGVREDVYCRQVGNLAGFVTLDKRLVRGGAHPHGIEICDLLGPGGELICVKRAARSSALSHLFFQAIVAAEHLCDGDSAYRKLLAMLPKSRRKDVPRRPDFVFAIQLTKGDLTPDSLFTFSKVALSRAARHLHRLHMTVSLNPIRTA